MEQPMINGYTNYIYGVLGPFSNDLRIRIDHGDFTVEGDRFNDVGARVICDDIYGYCWVIVSATDTNCRALGPFDQSQVLMDDNVVIGVRIDGKVVSLIDFKSLAVFDASDIWIIIRMPTDSNEDQSSFHGPAIPTDTNVPEVEGDLFQASELCIVDQSSAESDLQEMQPAPGYTGDLEGDGADHQAFDEVDGLTPPVVANGVETLQGDHEAATPWRETGAECIGTSVLGDEFEGSFTPAVDFDGLETVQSNHAVQLEHETHSGARESQSVGPIQNEGNISENVKGLETLLRLKSDEVPQTVDCAGHDAATNRGEPIVPTSHRAASEWMEMDLLLHGDIEGLPPTVHGNSGGETPLCEIDVVLEQASSLSFEGLCSFLGIQSNETPQQTGPDCAVDAAQYSGEPIVPTSHGAAGYWTTMLFEGGDEELAPTMQDNDDVREQDRPLSTGGVSQSLSSTDVSTASEGECSLKRARMAEEALSPRSVLHQSARNGSGNGAGSEAPIVPTSHDAAVPVIMVSESNDNEGLAPPVQFGNFVPTPQSDSGEVAGGMVGHMAGGTVATIPSTNPRGRQPATTKRPRQSKQKKFEHHGVTKRAGGRQSFAVYFRPKGLPESDKTFVTVGEFTNESGAWDAFNLFAFVHEGEEACINADIESISMDALVWENCPRVDLLAHLRLKGREYFRDTKSPAILPPGSEIPRYRSVKYKMSWKGKEKGNIRWFCDVTLSKEVVDPEVANFCKESSTYGTPQEAAKAADKLMIKREGRMAWTNYSLTDYMTDSQKEQWDNTWIPLQDNPKKYLSTVKR